MVTERSEVFDLIVVGGGAAGFFTAIRVAEMRPDLTIAILEKSNKLLAKVKISGGGRCNVTHNCFDPVKLSHRYPRGEKQIKNIFKQHHAEHTVAWFREKGVVLKTEEDGRMFPDSDSSQTIIDCFMRLALSLKIRIVMGEGVADARPAAGLFEISTVNGRLFRCKKMLIATGGNPSQGFYDWIARLGHTIKPPIPSLFTFNDSEKHFADLMGVSVPDAEVRIAGTKLSQRGPLLITHWGLSGPAVLKLSAWGADYLHRINYAFTALVSWAGPVKEDEVLAIFSALKTNKPTQKVMNHPALPLPQRLWIRLCERSDFGREKIWGEAAQKNINRLMELLIRCPFRIKGKTTFKEEFVTCGGVDLKEVDLSTMESKKVGGLYFAGEVLDIDGETGGFNFQAAWSTGFLAAKAIAEKP